MSRTWVSSRVREPEHGPVRDLEVAVGALAERVGHASEDAFSKVFKRVMGVSPVEFRRQAHPAR